MDTVGAEAVIVASIPDCRGVVLCAGEEEVVIAVVTHERGWALMPLHQDWPHGGGVVVALLVLTADGSGEESVQGRGSLKVLPTRISGDRGDG